MRAENQVVECDAVDHVVDRLLAVAGGVDRQSPQTSAGRGRESSLRRRNRPGRQHGEVQKVTPVERYFLDRPTIDHVPHGSCGPIDQGRLRFHRDFLRNVSDLEVHVLDEGPGNIHG